MVADYARLSLLEVEELCIIDYLQLLKDAIIYNCNQTKAGMEYLEKCWVMEQTDPDRESLRKTFAKKKV